MMAVCLAGLETVMVKAFPFHSISVALLEVVVFGQFVAVCPVFVVAVEMVMGEQPP